MNKNHLSKGFTLIELLIVITIIGILAVALLPSVLGAPARARDAARKADINNIIAGLETYNSDKQTYPTTKLCLGDNGADAGDQTLIGYFQGQKEPVDPQKAGTKTALNSGCAKGQYLYCPLKSPYNYFVAGYMEIAGDGNTTITLVSGDACDGSTTGPASAAGVDGDAAYVVSK